jgi:hypothetical protein
VQRLRFALYGAALAYFFDPDNGSKRREAAGNRFAKLRSKPPAELSDDLVGQARETK